MNKQYIVIEKGGYKSLRTINPFDNNDPRFTSPEPFCTLGMRPCGKAVCECEEWKNFEKSNPSLPYIGSKPVGSTVDESEVREVKQVKDMQGTWKNYDQVAFFGTGTIDCYETRTAYADAGPAITGRRLLSEQREDWLRKNGHLLNSQQYGLPAIHHKPALDREREEEYWKQRCIKAEVYISESPCDPDITPQQLEAWHSWQSIVKREPK